VLRGWSVGALSKPPNVNNSAKLIEEPAHANASGITKYTPVSLRLEPGKYHFDTEQEILSTNRHLLQGWMDLADVRWDRATKTLQGTARVIGGDPFHIAIANNGAKPSGGDVDLQPHPADGLRTLVLTAAETTDVQWSVKCEWRKTSATVAACL